MITGSAGVPLHAFRDDYGGSSIILLQKMQMRVIFRVVDSKGNTRDELSVKK
jgi:hypothetical protein